MYIYMQDYNLSFFFGGVVGDQNLKLMVLGEMCLFATLSPRSKMSLSTFGSHGVEVHRATCYDAGTMSLLHIR